MNKINILYCAIRQCNDSRFLAGMQRLSNNNCPKFSDRELITVYLWGLKQQLPTRKAIYNYTKTHLTNRFRNLPSYQAFCRRLNRLAGAFRALAEIWAEKAAAQSERSHHFMLDSCPILLAKDSRSNRAKVAGELCTMTRNPIRKQWYYGVKLHIIAMRRPGRLPIPCAMYIGSASLCDLWAAKQMVNDCAPVSNGTMFADRAYIDAKWTEELKLRYNIDLVTPRKKLLYEKVPSHDAFSTYVSSIRQPIESLFNWINVKTGIQNASHVRSIQGLLFHVFSALAFACWSLAFNY